MRPSRLVPLVLLALLALALVVAGCGGGGGTTEATETEAKAETKPTLTKAELIRQGDNICGEVNSAVGAAAGSETETTGTQVPDLYIGMIKSLQALGRPAEAEGYGEFMEASEELAKVEGEIKLATEREDSEALATASQEAVPALEEFQSQAAIYGFADCSEGPHAPTAATGGETAEPEAGAEEFEEESEIEVAPEEEFEEVAPEEEFVPEEEVEEVAPETGGAGGEIEEAPEAPVEEESESGGVGPG